MPSGEPAFRLKERRRAREEAFRLLFQADQGMGSFDDAVATERAETRLDAPQFDWACDLAAGAWAQRRLLDTKLNELATGWSTDRMASADLAILRLAAYEMLYRDDVPAPVSINEAVELAKRYGTDESPRFVNGLLGSLARRLAADHAAP